MRPDKRRRDKSIRDKTKRRSNKVKRVWTYSIYSAQHDQERQGREGGMIPDTRRSVSFLPHL